MNRMAPQIVVTLPARTVADARVQADAARLAGADLVEIRFDRFAQEEFGHLEGLFPPPCPLIATLRSRAEGGEGPDDPDLRRALLTDLARHSFRWIDVELARDLPTPDTLMRPGERGLIISSHAVDSVRAPEWSHLLRVDVPPGALRKVVARASVGQLLHELIPAIPPSGEFPIVALSTGPSGHLLRAWSRRFGFPMVYASLPDSDEASSPGPVESSQIPVDRLRPFLDAEGLPPLFALAGHPVAHSRSPALHSRWMKDRGQVGLYVGLDFEDDQEFVEAIPFLVDGGFRGLNVTHPFKAVALELASRVGPGAVACGVANVLSFGPDDVEAENTDLVAVLRRLEELRVAGRWDGSSVGVVGAGGSARATLAAAKSLGAEASVWARRPEESELLAERFEADAVRDPDRVRPTLVVHATPVGRQKGASSPLSEVRGWLRDGVHVLDWVYAPEDPTVRISAERSGATYEDGLRLLVYQAAASYGIWWGEEPSREQVSIALEEVA